MEKTLEFADLLRLMDDRSTAFQAAVAAAPSLDVRVPTCPEWTLLDLVQHLVDGRYRWAATVAAGPADAPTVVSAPATPRERGAVLAWFAASVRELLDALRQAGPDRGCWTWWGTSQSPQTSGAVARHQLQQLAVHTYDAQVAVGAPQPLPDDVALDGVDEFLTTCCATASPWPHQPAVVDYHATDGGSWRLWLSADGARTAHLPSGAATGEGGERADVAAWGTANDLVMFFYGRITAASLRVEGDPGIFDQLIAWEPE
ncbi:maleylpyruvate isomerase family mycothiol-dependent enzyme [Dactylosporangium aurantiacum]|uniref:Maleylpyruvate isomerase family mycothiol-dependent enzyme n=1 Tax=Dactylosporangium aurantiacum TaxID=35754 RepID=A0A9Q9IMK9_9ACTN|nr:maleylpyruvate isomerase family mycothiol-dependent enzyme [Dactylosporangium aurantiacum]MDG6106192.1 maleylpyruvate isomerase family mycothiol-dependent enzyme [Dactylosporangium aurantiacum]UWZ58306.1 maleylpyruvate isomerase family mycothiol-dependent enzyme [Dactylosporangium aurantiacum]